MERVVYKTVFENQHFIIVDKSAMVLSVPARTGDADPRPCLGTILERDLNCQIFPVHRLDFEVSGLIMYAKTGESHRAANKWFENKIIDKTYVALTCANNTPSVRFQETFNWECLLLRGKKRAYESPVGKKSHTSGSLLGRDSNGNYRWHLNPITGRSHQLRFELFRHGCPIMGDELYGSQEKFLKEGIALRSFQINFDRIPEREKFGLDSKIQVLEIF